MNYISLDGIEMNVPMSQESSFQELIQFFKETLVAEKSLISRIKVNGTEVSDPYREEIAQTPISTLQTIEIYTSHPKELADETLQHLLEYTHVLESLCQSSAENVNVPEFHNYFLRLVEGISTFTEAVTEVKKLLRVTTLQSINVLEMDLLSILRDVLESREKNETIYLQELLSQHLCKNLKDWREQGIPDLIRLRDC